MHSAWLYLLLSCLLFSVLPAEASMVVNEVLFYASPVNDKGLEKIELYNNADTAADISGWDLYPDGIGYFTFPAGSSIPAKSFAVVYLRVTGISGGADFYHSSPSSNIGNTSGSVALFNSTTHKKETLVDFVEWSTKGTSSTWESDASLNRLWVKGAPFDSSLLAAGSSIGLLEDGVRKDAASWRIYLSPTMGSANSGATGTVSVNATSSVDTEAQNSGETSGSGLKPTGDIGRKIPPSLHVYGGEDRAVFQGALVEFRGVASGINGESLGEGRFSWNFGDGATADGKLISHVYYFPGNYNVSLNVSSGEHTGADYLKIAVVEPDIFISEVKSGKAGFIELYNNTSRRLDLGGFLLKDGSRTFAIARDTFIDPNAAIVFANALTGLLETPAVVSFRNAFDSQVDGGDFSDSLLTDESFERAAAGNIKFVKTKTPTPGFYTANVSLQNANAAVNNYSGEEPSSVKDKNSASVVKPTENKDSGDVKKVGGDPFSEKNSAAFLGSAAVSSWFLASSIVMGILVAAGFLFLKKRV